LLRFVARPAGEEPLEDRPRIDLLGHRGRFGSPGDVRRIGAGIAAVAGAGLLPRLAAQLERGEPRLAADLLGGHLVDRDANFDVRPPCLPRMAAGQKAGERPGVVAGTVAERESAVLCETG